MTALKPIEWRHVVGVAAERYPSNLICAHPECSDPVQLRPDGTPTVHHVFPRSLTKSDSYFVLLTEQERAGEEFQYPDPIPHAVGLCGSGTTGHHGDVEEHRAWIKLEDGVFSWYDRQSLCPPDSPIADTYDVVWDSRGPLNPQPGSVEGKPKKKKRAKQPARAKAVFSIRVPKDEAENGYEVLSTLIDEVRDKYGPELGWSETAPPYFVVVAALVRALQD